MFSFLGPLTVAPGGTLTGSNTGTLLTVTGDVVLNGGTLDLNGDIVNAGGNFATLNGGLLKSLTAGSTLNVTSNASFAGASTIGSLTAGLLSVGGNFTQGGPAASSFVADILHTTHFTGGTVYNVTFNAPASSRFGKLLFDSGTLQLNSDAVAAHFEGNGGVIASSDLQLTATADMAVDAVTFDGTRMLFDGTSTGFQYFDNATFVNMNTVLPQLKLNYDGSGSKSLLNDDFDDAGALFVEATSVFLNPFSLSFNGPDVLLGPARTSTPGGQVTVTWP